MRKDNQENEERARENERVFAFVCAKIRFMCHILGRDKEDESFAGSRSLLTLNPNQYILQTLGSYTSTHKKKHTRAHIHAHALSNTTGRRIRGL